MTDAQTLKRLRWSLQRLRAYLRPWASESVQDVWDKYLGWFLPWGGDRRKAHRD